MNIVNRVHLPQNTFTVFTEDSEGKIVKEINQTNTWTLDGFNALWSRFDMGGSRLRGDYYYPSTSDSPNNINRTGFFDIMFSMEEGIDITPLTKITDFDPSLVGASAHTVLERHGTIYDSFELVEIEGREYVKLRHLRSWDFGSVEGEIRLVGLLESEHNFYEEIRRPFNEWVLIAGKKLEEPIEVTVEEQLFIRYDVILPMDLFSSSEISSVGDIEENAFTTIPVEVNGSIHDVSMACHQILSTKKLSPRPPNTNELSLYSMLLNLDEREVSINSINHQSHVFKFNQLSYDYGWIEPNSVGFLELENNILESLSFKSFISIEEGEHIDDIFYFLGDIEGTIGDFYIISEIFDEYNGPFKRGDCVIFNGLEWERVILSGEYGEYGDLVERIFFDEATLQSLSFLGVYEPQNDGGDGGLPLNPNEGDFLKINKYSDQQFGNWRGVNKGDFIFYIDGMWRRIRANVPYFFAKTKAEIFLNPEPLKRIDIETIITDGNDGSFAISFNPPLKKTEEERMHLSFTLIYEAIQYEF